MVSLFTYLSGYWTTILFYPSGEKTHTGNTHINFLSEVKIAQLCPNLWDPQLDSPWNSPGQSIGLYSCSLIQGIFPTQGLNPSLLHCRQLPYQLNHRGSPRVLEWAAYPFSSRSSQPRNQTWVSCIAGRFFTNWAIREAPILAEFNFILFSTRFNYIEWN